MEPAEKKRKLILGGALVATLIAVVLVGDDDELTIDTIETIQPTQSSAKARTSIDNINHLEIDLLGERTFNADAGELFKSTSWTPKRPPISVQQQAEMAAAQQQAARAAAATATPPTPTPPPLPFTYLGKVIDGNNIQVFLADPEQNYVVRLGGRIENQYRIDAIDDDAVTLTYLPLDARQTLAINQTDAGNNR